MFGLQPIRWCTALLVLAASPSCSRASRGIPRCDAIGQTEAARDRGLVTLNAAGDVAYPSSWAGMEKVPVETRKRFDNYVRAHRAELLAELRPLLGKTDVSFANLECPFTEAPTRTKSWGRAYACAPAVLEPIVEAGFNLFSLANNHMMDSGLAGLEATLFQLEQRTDTTVPLRWAGAGRNRRETLATVFFRPPRSDLEIALLAFADAGDDTHIASIRSVGLAKRIARAAQRADVVIVSAHHGRHFDHVPRPDTVRLYHGFVDAGADVVLGHGPHVIQGVEGYGGGVIFYSLGNLSFGWPMHSAKATEGDYKMYGLLGRIGVSRSGVTHAEIVPLYVDSMRTWTLGGQTLRPKIATPQILRAPFSEAVLEDLTLFGDSIPGAKSAKICVNADRGVLVLR